MDERRRFIERYLESDWPVTAIATSFGISRKTAYKWIGRFKRGGLVNLCNASRAPLSCPHATPASAVAAIVALRKQKRLWGPKKLQWWLEKHHPGAAWPATSTIGEILRREGLSHPRPRRRRQPPRPQTLTVAKGPNEVWAADFKGWFRTRDGRRIDPLTITDTASRYLFKCEGLAQPGNAQARPVFETAFREYGLPRILRSDNGQPFASIGFAGLTRLSAWWIRLGIMPERIQPAHPEQNGRHERMHRTLKDATAKPPKANHVAQQQAFDEFRREYNEERPHESLGMRTPAECHRLSPRPFPEKLPDMEYGSDYSVRMVHTAGEITVHGQEHFLSEVLVGERVGLLPLADGIWAVDYGDYRLGYYDGRKKRLARQRPQEAESIRDQRQSVTHVPG